LVVLVIVEVGWSWSWELLLVPLCTHYLHYPLAPIFHQSSSHHFCVHIDCDVADRMQKAQICLPSKSPPPNSTITPSCVTYTHQSYTPSYHTINTARAYTSRYVLCSSVSYPKSSVSPSCAAPALLPFVLPTPHSSYPPHSTHHDIDHATRIIPLCFLPLHHHMPLHSKNPGAAPHSPGAGGDPVNHSGCTPTQHNTTHKHTHLQRHHPHDRHHRHTPPLSV
jgi:hypothetical protein